VKILYMPESRSVTTFTRSTVPWLSNNERITRLVVKYADR
jgi:hypothetical protein